MLPGNPHITYSSIYKQTRCWQCTAISNASEANTTASVSTELGSALGRRRYEMYPCYTSGGEVALAADTSASGIQDPATHSTSLAPGYNDKCVSRRQPVSSLRSSEHNQN